MVIETPPQALGNGSPTCEYCGESHGFTGFVYRQTNTTNHKWYIGSHFGCPNDGYKGSGTIFLKAIQAHGYSAFEREFVFLSWGTREELLDAEELILLQCDAANDRNSYNVKNKGSGQDPRITSAVFLGKPKKPESIAQGRATVRERGSLAGTKNPRAQPVVCLGSQEVFDYARLAANAIKGTDAGISEACQKGYKHRREYWMFQDAWEALGQPDIHPLAKKANWRVVRLTDGKVYENSARAGADHNIRGSTITAALDSPSQSAAEHHWMRYTTWLSNGCPIRSYEPYQRAIDQVVDITSGKVYRTAADCGREAKLTEENVRNSCKGRYALRRFYWLDDWAQAGKPRQSLSSLEKAKRNRKKGVRIRDTLDARSSWLYFESRLSAAKYISEQRGEKASAGGVSVAASHQREYKGFQIEDALQS